MRVFVAFAILASVAAAAPVPKEKAKEQKTDEELIVGRWKMVELDVGGGQKVPLPDDWKRMEYVFAEGGKLTMVEPKRTMDATFKLDAAAKPKTLDMTRQGQLVIKGLYELDGDTLKLCITQKPGADRPAEIKGDAAKFTAVFVLARVKEEKK